MTSLNTGQPCLLANLQTENRQNTVLRFGYTGHSYGIYSHPCPHPARLGRSLQFSAVFMSVPQCEEGKHTHKEGGFHIPAKHGLSKSSGIKG